MNHSKTFGTKLNRKVITYSLNQIKSDDIANQKHHPWGQFCVCEQTSMSQEISKLFFYLESNSIANQADYQRPVLLRQKDNSSWPLARADCFRIKRLKKNISNSPTWLVSTSSHLSLPSEFRNNSNCAAGCFIFCDLCLYILGNSRLINSGLRAPCSFLLSASGVEGWA